MSTEEIGYKANNKICRLCLKSCENSIAIFDDGNTVVEKTLKECLEDIAKILLSPADNLPETVCQTCYKSCSDSYAFVLRIRKNDEFLHNILQCDFINDDKYSDLAHTSDDNETSNAGGSHPEQLALQDADSFDHVQLGSDLNEVENSIPEEGELPQYIEITYIQPSTELESFSTTTVPEEPTSGVISIQCSYCQRIFSSMRYKRDHERSHFKEGRKCSHCERRFLKKCDWTRHVNSHTLEKTFKCTICDRVFFSLAELNRHTKVHNPARDHKCTHCNSEFKDITALKFHIRTVHFKERPYCCPNCGSAFSTASKVRRHQKSRICSETKSITTVHHGCEEEFLIFENTYQISPPPVGQ